MYYVDNMAKAQSFYKKVLGSNPSYESDSWTEFSIGQHNLCLHTKDPSQKYAPNGILIINAKNVKALYEQMKKDDLDVFGLHQVHPEAWSFHLKDYTGNEVSFYGTP